MLQIVLERVSWGKLSEFLLPKRGITAVFFLSLSSELVWHPMYSRKDT